MKKYFSTTIASLALLATPVFAGDWVVYEGNNGPGRGKHIVFVTGDEEYRSEECMPMLARILAVHQGFKCTVLFAINPADGTIDPVNQTNIAGLEQLKSADLMVIFTRFRELPDQQMKFIVDFVNSGKPILGLRTATHAFDYSRNLNSPYATYGYRSKDWPGGFGQQVLGETWVNHHGVHGKESSRGVINEAFKNHPVLRGVEDIWAPSDVYTVTHLPKDAQVLVYGQVLAGMNPTDKPVASPKNNPMMPMIWLRNFTGDTGKTARIFCSTMGSAVDLQNEGLRRLLVNACFWGVGLEDKIPPQSKVDYVGDYQPSYFGFGQFKKGLKPADYNLK